MGALRSPRYSGLKVKSVTVRLRFIGGQARRTSGLMEATSSPSTGGDDPTLMQFPMYVMRMKDFLALDLMIPHGTLVDQGLCVPYDAGIARAGQLRQPPMVELDPP